MLDTSAITGESVLRSVKPGEEVVSGTINTNALIYVRVTKEYGESTVAKILDMVENAGSKNLRQKTLYQDSVDITLQ